MTDRSQDALRRHLEVNPQDTEARAKLTQIRARVEGLTVYLEVLQDRDTWRASPIPLQDMAIGAVKNLLRPDYDYLETKLYECAGLSHRIASFHHEATGMRLQLIPGHHDVREYGKDGLGPLILDRLIQPLLIGQYPVLQREWDLLGGDDERRHRGPNLPIDSVTVKSCLDWLRRAGGGLGLPQCEEWIYACRAGSTTEYFWGEEMRSSYCWYYRNSGELRKEPQDCEIHAREKKWNAFGLVDVLGNIEEWAYVPRLDDNLKFIKGPRNSPLLEQERFRCHGGSFRSDPQSCHFKSTADPADGRCFEVGFRAVRIIEVTKLKTQ